MIGPVGAPKLPEGSIELSVEDAIAAIVTSDHAEPPAHSMKTDAAIIELLNRGLLRAWRLPDNRLAFAGSPRLMDPIAWARGLMGEEPTDSA